ncbi:hypothetical protein P9112_005548 [Eukaryota sp. TZLM1-RC]
MITSTSPPQLNQYARIAELQLSPTEMIPTTPLRRTTTNSSLEALMSSARKIMADVAARPKVMESQSCSPSPNEPALLPSVSPVQSPNLTSPSATINITPTSRVLVHSPSGPEFTLYSTIVPSDASTRNEIAQVSLASTIPPKPIKPPKPSAIVSGNYDGVEYVGHGNNFQDKNLQLKSLEFSRFSELDLMQHHDSAAPISEIQKEVQCNQTLFESANVNYADTVSPMANQFDAINSDTIVDLNHCSSLAQSEFQPNKPAECIQSNQSKEIGQLCIGESCHNSLSNSQNSNLGAPMEGEMTNKDYSYHITNQDDVMDDCGIVDSDFVSEAALNSRKASIDVTEATDETGIEVNNNEEELPEHIEGHSVTTAVELEELEEDKSTIQDNNSHSNCQQMETEIQPFTPVHFPGIQEETNYNPKLIDSGASIETGSIVDFCSRLIDFETHSSQGKQLNHLITDEPCFESTKLRNSSDGVPMEDENRKTDHVYHVTNQDDVMDDCGIVDSDFVSEDVFNSRKASIDVTEATDETGIEVNNNEEELPEHIEGHSVTTAVELEELEEDKSTIQDNNSHSNCQQMETEIQPFTPVHFPGIQEETNYNPKLIDSGTSIETGSIVDFCSPLIDFETHSSQGKQLNHLITDESCFESTKLRNSSDGVPMEDENRKTDHVYHVTNQDDVMDDDQYVSCQAGGEEPEDIMYPNDELAENAVLYKTDVLVNTVSSDSNSTKTTVNCVENESVNDEYLIYDDTGTPVDKQLTVSEVPNQAISKENYTGNSQDQESGTIPEVTYVSSEPSHPSQEEVQSENIDSTLELVDKVVPNSFDVVKRFLNREKLSSENHMSNYILNKNEYNLITKVYFNSKEMSKRTFEQEIVLLFKQCFGVPSPEKLPYRWPGREVPVQNLLQGKCSRDVKELERDLVFSSDQKPFLNHRKRTQAGLHSVQNKRVRLIY